MFALEKFAGPLLAAALVAGSATVAGAVTVVSDGGSYIIGPGGDNEFIGDVSAGGGAGSYVVEFSSLIDPLKGTVSATIGNIVAGTFTNLVMSWVAVSDGFVLASTPVTPTTVTLDTVFTDFGVLGGDDNPQWLKFTWDNSIKGAGFDFEVAAVPLPAGGLLLIGAVGGLAALRRRKTV